MNDMEQEQQQAAPLGLPRNLLECGICLSLVCEPVSLSCGHTFCRCCLVKTMHRSAKRCPCCRAVCHTRAEDQPQNVMIAQIVKAVFPEQLQRRMRETEAEKAKFELCLPAFFYNVTMFPGETLALHFFEPRYKLMMKRVIDTTRRFAYVPKYANYVACKGDTALVAEVVDAEFLSDGRVLSRTKLVGRYTIQDHFVEEGTQGLHHCQLEPYEDDVLEGESAKELEELHDKARALCHGFLGPFKSQLVQSHGEMPAGAVGLSMWMASFLPFYVPEKHALLVSRCTRGRLRACLRCAASMERVARGVQRGEEVTEGAPPPTPSDAEAAAANAAAAAATAAAAAASSEGGTGGDLDVGAPAPEPPAEAGVTLSAGGQESRSEVTPQRW